MTLFLMILGGVASLALGIWLGLGRYDQSPSDLERRLGEKGQRRKAKRHFMYLDYLRPGSKGSERKKRSQRSRFRTVSPKRPSQDKDEDAGK